MAKSLKVNDLIGIRYVPHGRTLAGLDCYGLVKIVFARCGIELPEYDADYHDYERIKEIYLTERNTPPWEQASGYDEYPLLLAIRFGTPFVNHCGVYIGNGKFIHTRENIGVVIEDISLWKRRIEGAYRYVQVNNNKKPVQPSEGQGNN